MKMILNKYQVKSKIEKRGYSSTASIQNEDGEIFFAKWLKGIKKNSQQSKILNDKLRQLKKAVHPSLPQIIEYDWDESENAYCIVFENKDAKTLEEKISDLRPVYFLRGIEQIISCLQQLQQKHRISHGDITPANILVDDDNDFYLIDFGISDIANTLSQEQELEVFAGKFAAPEKWNREIPKGFAYQSDIFSIGKVIEWYFKSKEIREHNIIEKLVNNCCKEIPAERTNYNSLIESISKINRETSFDNQNIIHIAFSDCSSSKLIDELNNEYFGDKSFLPVFNVSLKLGKNVLLDINTMNFTIHCLWIIEEQKLLIRNYSHKTENEEKYSSVQKFGQKLGLPVVFKMNCYSGDKFNLTPILQKIQKEKQHEGDYRLGKKKISDELRFFKDLLKQELKVIEKNALKLCFSSFDEKEGNYEISFKIQENKKYSSNGFIFNHIDKATPPNPEEFEYIISNTADKKQMKDPMRFLGIAFDFNHNPKERILKFKDCERLDFDKIPKNGYIFQNTSKQEEEKKRQLEAIRKVEFNEVQNRDLIHYLFNPKDLQGKYIDIHELEKVYQTDKEGNRFVYSHNQQRAIINAIHREPLTVIQGPPGTGKTTVITEIVFQILEKNPDAKILITSQTNDAVDNVLDNLLKKKIPIVRLSGVRKPKESLRKHTLDRKIEGWKEQVKKKAKANWKPQKDKFKKQLEKQNNVLLLSIFEILSSDRQWRVKKQEIEKIAKEVHPRLSNRQWKVKKTQIEKWLGRIGQSRMLSKSLNSESEFITSLQTEANVNLTEYFQKQQIYKDWLTAISSLDEKSSINQKLIDSIRVIGATTNHIASKKYAKYNFDFDYVIMDESGKATTAEALIPLVLGNKAVLVGDHRQLRPMLTSNREVKKWLREKHKSETDEYDSWDDYFDRASLFEQVITRIDDDFRSQLDECRRSSKEQVRLTSKCFYEQYGDKPIQPVDRPQEKEHNLDLKVDGSIIFLDTGNSYKSEIDGSGSTKNRQSAKLIPAILRKLYTFEKVKNYNIGVITGYTAQLKEIKRQLRNKKFKNIDLRNNRLVVSVVDKFQGLEKDIIIFDLARSRQNTLGFLANANRINVALSRQKRLLIIIGNYDWLVQAKAAKSSVNSKVALQAYLKEIKKEWRVNSIEQIF